VLKALINALGGQERMKLRRVVADFESGVWQAVCSGLPDHVKIQGCSFHWAQAVFRKVQAYGLEVCCVITDITVYNYINR